MTKYEMRLRETKVPRTYAAKKFPLFCAEELEKTMRPLQTKLEIIDDWIFKNPGKIQEENLVDVHFCKAMVSLIQCWTYAIREEEKIKGGTKHV